MSPGKTRRKSPRKAGTTILFQRQLFAAEETLEKLGIPLPPRGERSRFFDLCSTLPLRPAGIRDFPWIFEKYPEATCYAVLKLYEAMRERTWSFEARTLKKPRRAITKEQFEAAMQYQSTRNPKLKQSKAEENAAREMRRRASQP